MDWRAGQRGEKKMVPKKTFTRYHSFKVINFDTSLKITITKKIFEYAHTSDLQRPLVKGITLLYIYRKRLSVNRERERKVHGEKVEKLIAARRNKIRCPTQSHITSRDDDDSRNRYVHTQAHQSGRHGLRVHKKK